MAVLTLMAAVLIVTSVTVTLRFAVGPTVAGSASPSPTASMPASPSPNGGEPSPAASLSAPAPGADASPAPISRAWELPERAWERLPKPDAHSRLYAAQVAGLNALPPVVLAGCPAPRALEEESDEASEALWRADVQAQWSCVHASWVPVLERLSLPSVEPHVAFYTGSGAASPCGFVFGPAFYCSAGAGSAYFGSEHLEMARTWDLAVKEMVNHEYGHHLQSLFGITEAKLESPGARSERRSELQALCLSAVMTYHDRSFEFDERDYESWEERLDSMLIDGVHGSRESLRYWGTRGLYASTLGDCNTWVAADAQVS